MSKKLIKKYNEEMVPALMKELGYTNRFQVPKMSKITVNVGLGEGATNAKILDSGLEELTRITGQKAVITRAKKSIAGFKIREGMPVGARVTLRGERMYDFLSKLINISLPRIRDFRGLSDKSFDGRGNYNIGLKDQLVFPEISYDEIDRMRGMNITLATTARTDMEGRALLAQFGFPFKKAKESKGAQELSDAKSA